jgi:hypothetical protein
MIKKTTLAIILLIRFSSLIYCQTYTKLDIENKFINKWTLKSVEVNNKPTPLNAKQKNAHALFSKDSTYTNTSENGLETGSWYFNCKKQVLILNDGKGDNPDMKMKIERLTDKECVLLLPEAKNGAAKIYLVKVEDFEN